MRRRHAGGKTIPGTPRLHPYGSLMQGWWPSISDVPRYPVPHRKKKSFLAGGFSELLATLSTPKHGSIQNLSNSMTLAHHLLPESRGGLLGVSTKLVLWKGLWLQRQARPALPSRRPSRHLSLPFHPIQCSLEELRTPQCTQQHKGSPLCRLLSLASLWNTGLITSGPGLYSFPEDHRTHSPAATSLLK